MIFVALLEMQERCEMKICQKGPTYLLFLFGLTAAEAATIPKKKGGGGGGGTRPARVKSRKLDKGGSI